MKNKTAETHIKVLRFIKTAVNGWFLHTGGLIT